MSTQPILPYKRSYNIAVSTQASQQTGTMVMLGMAYSPHNVVSWLQTEMPGGWGVYRRQFLTLTVSW
jgi:hypothetical protein